MLRLLLALGSAALLAPGGAAAAERRLLWGAGADEDRLPGWKGEVSRKAKPLTIGQQHQKEDRERGTWVELLSWRPRAYVIHNFMSPEEALLMIKTARPFMTRSTVVDSVTGESKVDPIRTSEQTFLPRGQYEIVTRIEKRLARITMLPWENGEDMQILKYGLGQKYDAHHDVGELTSVSGAQLARDGGFRVATSLLYLTDVEEGGDALVFWSIMPNNEIDPASMHAGCPVIKGEKWTGTKWIHAEPFRWRPPPPPPDTGGCKDKNPTCKAWANSGECKKNPEFMWGKKGAPGVCVKACKKCPQVFDT